MLKFSLYVFVGYAIYYAVAIGLEFLKNPNVKKEKVSQSFIVAGAEEEAPTVVGDIEMSPDANAAIEKKNN